MSQAVPVDIESEDKHRSVLLPLLLLAQLPSIVWFTLQSTANPLVSSFPFALVIVGWITVRHFIQARERWKFEHLLLVFFNIVFFVGAMFRGSAWLACVGVSFSIIAWTLSRRDWIPLRTVAAVAVLLALLVRLPPYVQSAVDQSWHDTITSQSSAILHAAGFLHFVDVEGIHLAEQVVDDRYFRSGAASPWVLLLVCTGLVMFLRRSITHHFLLLAGTLGIGLMTSVGATVFGVMMVHWTGIDFSSGAAGVFWRLDWLIAGVAMIWCVDHIVLLLCAPIPLMGETVTGRKVPLGGADEMIRESEVCKSGNPFTDAWNCWVAPLPPVYQVGSLAPAEVSLSEREDSSTGIDAASTQGFVSRTELEQARSVGLLGLTSVVSAMMLIAQFVHYFKVGG